MPMHHEITSCQNFADKKYEYDKKIKAKFSRF